MWRNKYAHSKSNGVFSFHPTDASVGLGKVCMERLCLEQIFAVTSQRGAGAGSARVLIGDLVPRTCAGTSFRVPCVVRALGWWSSVAAAKVTTVLSRVVKHRWPLRPCPLTRSTLPVTMKSPSPHLAISWGETEAQRTGGPGPHLVFSMSPGPTAAQSTATLDGSAQAESLGLTVLQGSLGKYRDRAPGKSEHPGPGSAQWLPALPGCHCPCSPRPLL